MTVFLDLEDALGQINYLGFHLLDLGLLEGCLARPKTTLFGDEAYPSLLDKAAALMHSVATTHPLIDGKKRTSWAQMITFLAVNGSEVVSSPDDGFSFVLSVATDSLEVSAISQWIASRMKPITQLD